MFCRKSCSLLIFLVLGFLLFSCEKKPESRLDFLQETAEEKRERLIKEHHALIDWKDLIPKGFETNPEIIKLQQQISLLEDGDSRGLELYEKLIEEFNKAPVNYDLNDKDIRIAGFIAPLEMGKDEITDFILVPYFGACIHTPPPPQNQMVLISAPKGQGVQLEKSDGAILIAGKLKIADANTQFGNVGYSLEQPVILY